MHFNGPSGPQEHVVQRLQEEDRDVEQRERDKREREFLEEQIKAHAQTVDILVSEKSSLQKEMSSLASKLNESQGEHRLGRVSILFDFNPLRNCCVLDLTL
jgi:uncharacterized protein (DUF305 family)